MTICVWNALTSLVIKIVVNQTVLTIRVVVVVVVFVVFVAVFFFWWGGDMEMDRNGFLGRLEGWHYETTNASNCKHQAGMMTMRVVRTVRNCCKEHFWPWKPPLTSLKGWKGFAGTSLHSLLLSCRWSSASLACHPGLADLAACSIVSNASSHRDGSV